jgi:hypothetical protein
VTEQEGNIGACGVGHAYRLEGDVEGWSIRGILSVVLHRKWSNVTRSDEMRQAEGSC